MPRRGPKSDDPIERFELKWRNDAMLKQLQDEALLRGVTLQQHIYDIVRARWLWQQGKSIDPFWTPPNPSSLAQDSPTPEDTSGSETTSAAKAAAAAWLDED